MNWKTTWSYLPIDYNTTIGTIENITQRTRFWNNINGEKVRVKFSNKYGHNPIVLEKVVIGQKSEKNNLIVKNEILTYCGSERIEVGAGEEFYSDEKEWKIEAGTEIVISVYFKEKQEIQSACETWHAESWSTRYALNGDYCLEQGLDEKRSKEIYPFIALDVNEPNVVVGISGISLYTKEDVKTIAMFGDSITHMSYYADALAERIYQEHVGGVVILNRGIGGNRILHDATYLNDMDGHGKIFGDAAISRFEEDVYGDGHVEYVLILEGVNDMMHPYQFDHLDEVVTAKQLADGLAELAAIAHRRNSKVYFGTVMPFRNDDMVSLPESEAVRKELNQWIRNQSASDGYFEFALVLGKGDNQEYLNSDYHIGDGLHPNTAGGTKMAEVVLGK